jgi:hypothetical protein
MSEHVIVIEPTGVGLNLNISPTLGLFEIPMIFDAKFQMTAASWAPSLLATCPDNPVLFWTTLNAPNVEESNVDELTLWPEAPHARTSAWLDAVQDWTAHVADYSGTNAVSLMRALPVGFSGRTSLALCRATTVTTSPPCCGGSPERGPTCPRTGGEPSACASVPVEPPSGGCLTLAGSEWPNAAAVCSLSQVLEASVDPKYSLSPRAAAGILDRARRRGRALPPSLETALERVAQTTTKLKPAI